jgi:hypothetical protein
MSGILSPFQPDLFIDGFGPLLLPFDASMPFHGITIETSVRIGTSEIIIIYFTNPEYSVIWLRDMGSIYVINS